MLKHVASFLAGVLLLMFSAGNTAVAQTSYTEVLEKRIKEEIIQYGDGIDSSIQVKVVKLQKVPKKNYYTALFTFKSNSLDYLGEASFIKKNGEYQHVDGYGFGVDKVGHTTITVDNQLYNVIYGENTEKQIGSIDAELINKPIKYSLTSVDSPYFVHFQALPLPFKMKDAYPTKLTCYDQKYHQMTWDECARES
ncbi:hypothetical protein [Priestia aryabhattai]|uniref:hypothetical protein n=1 Tax=Priestia aryabhattai TaxID=412384 RepID=UPI002658D52E|nr:hypothetical protein [Priestia aryabhattai]WKG29222.1 hypothetical protein QYS54_18925 [Priestia aryabhattai]